MNNPGHYQTAIEDRIPFTRKLIYGFGGFVNNFLAQAIGTMVIVLNLGLGINPALVGLVSALPRLIDAITDPLMGYISDHTKSRWGRRRPYIFAGAIAAGIIYILLWQLPEGKTENFYFWFFLSGSIVFYLAYTMFATPWVALGYELTPDYHERTRLMGVQNFIGQFALLIAPWFLWFMTMESLHDDMLVGAARLALIVGILTIGVGVLPAVFLRERFNASKVGEGDDPDSANADVSARPVWKQVLGSLKDFFRGFLITLKFKPFLKLCAATFLVFNGFMMVQSFQSYVIIYYVFGGDTAQGALYAGWAGTVAAISTFCVIYLTTWMATRIGKRRAFFITAGVSIIGYALKWVCYRPEMPILVLIPPALYAFGLGGLFTLMGSMMADVCDLDELETGERREGMYGSIFWWVVKLGMAAALAAGGFLLNATGFEVALGGDQTDDALLLMRLADLGVPIVTSAIAFWAIITYTLTEEKAYEVRQQLERRRGKIGVAN